MGVIGVVGLTVHDSQAVEEERTIAAVRIRILAVRHGGRGKNRFQHLDGLIEAAQCIIVQSDVIAELQIVIGDKGLRFLQRGQRLLVVALLALDLRLVDQGLRQARDRDFAEGPDLAEALAFAEDIPDEG